jgi:hypothetical protein
MGLARVFAPAPDDPIHRLLVHGTPPDVSRPRESQGHAPIMRATAQG